LRRHSRGLRPRLAGSHYKSARANGWGADESTGFVDNTRLNSFATYANLRAEYAKLAVVDRVFRKLVENLTNTTDWFAAFFLLRAHSGLLAGSHMAMAGLPLAAEDVLAPRRSTSDLSRDTTSPRSTKGVRLL
jgi:hypothetical protein